MTWMIKKIRIRTNATEDFSLITSLKYISSVNNIILFGRTIMGSQVQSIRIWGTCSNWHLIRRLYLKWTCSKSWLSWFSWTKASVQVTWTSATTKKSWQCSSNTFWIWASRITTKLSTKHILEVLQHNPGSNWIKLCLMWGTVLTRGMDKYNWLIIPAKTKDFCRQYHRMVLLRNLDPI